MNRREFVVGALLPLLAIGELPTATPTTAEPEYVWKSFTRTFENASGDTRAFHQVIAHGTVEHAEQWMSDSRKTLLTATKDYFLAKVVDDAPKHGDSSFAVSARSGSGDDVYTAAVLQGYLTHLFSVATSGVFLPSTTVEMFMIKPVLEQTVEGSVYSDEDLYSMLKEPDNGIFLVVEEQFDQELNN